MSDELRIERLPSLRDPVLVAAFKGWNDGGQGATMAVSHLLGSWSAEQIGDIDGEGFIDFQATRPVVRIDEARQRRVDWPENLIYTAPIPGAERDALILLGVEPSYRWRTFAGLIAGLAQQANVGLVVTLGALLGDVPHTRPSPVSGAATDAAVAERLGLQVSRYEGPTGIVGVLHAACHDAGVPSVSLWAAVPHYVSLAPSPRAARALLERLGSLVGADIDVEALQQSELAYTAQVSAAVAADPDTATYVEELERRADSLEHLDLEGDLPSGDALAAELTRFLREQESKGDG